MFKKIFEYPFFAVMYVLGLIRFWLTKTTGKQAYSAMRFYFAKTNGWSNKLISNLFSILFPKYTNVPSIGIFGHYTDAQINDISKELNSNGYYVFNTYLDDHTIQYLHQFALSHKTQIIDPNAQYPRFLDEQITCDLNNIISPRYDFIKQDLFNDEVILNLATDPSILKIAQTYLGCRPVLDKITMWWSFPFQQKAKSAAAQMYHFDLDRLRFLKFFFYLTDVTPESGPHCYVQSSHQFKPKSVRTDGRKTDEMIESVYGKANCKEISGKKGTILAVDTSGFHKGKPLTMDKRLILQLEFANSLFGAEVEYVKKPTSLSQTSKKMITDYPHTYAQIMR